MNPANFLLLCLGWLIACRVTPTLQDSSYAEEQRDGAIPVVDVEMVAPQRWQTYRKGLDNLKRELSFIIDKELEREKKRLFSTEDQRLAHIAKASTMQLKPFGRKGRHAGPDKRA
ncbi:extracellular solute-binding family 3, putative [Babesia ovis]|uniref:Extracellular solute-binding family 3, putative n=1 Tax=Babesia ovis TaxID=5869 RepID=A0A9W5TDJ4_BABOV|nr:extracellular solute-binding family 3, putative [Babesia ovis]